MDNNDELLNSQNEQEVGDTSSESDTYSEENEEEQEELEKLRQQNKELFARAKRAEGFEMVNGKWVKKKPKVEEKKEDVQKDDFSFSPKDYLALTEHKVSSELFDEVVRLSKLMGMSIADTLKDKTAKGIIDGKAQELASAEATASKPSSKRSGGENQADVLIKKAEKGEDMSNSEMGTAAKALVDSWKTKH